MKKLSNKICLNLGCGTNKIKGCINIDKEKSCNPDLLLDFLTVPLPYKDKEVDEVYLFHTIEHIRKTYHRYIFSEIARVLKRGGRFYISYPEFWECAKNWHDNIRGERTFWEATLYGRQLYPSDFHVCIMDSLQLVELLAECGFTDIKHRPEKEERHNSITSCTRGEWAATPYEQLVATDTRSMVVNK